MDDQTVLLASIVKLLNGDKDKGFQRIAAIRKQYPAKSMEWCLQKVIYDLRHGTKLPPPPAPPANPTLSTPKPTLQHWGLTGAVLKATEEKPLAISTRDLEALAKAKRKMPSQPASEASRRRLYNLVLGNADQARRLVERLRISNPDRSEQWAVEKAIYDLERDRC